MVAAIEVTVVPVSALGRIDRGWSRGHAHLRMDDVPRTAPGWLEFGPLRLFGIEQIDAGAGYKMHPHADVETITVPLAGAFLHDDNLAGPGRTATDDVAVLSAGSGMQHAELAEAGAL